jgi:hypothetical protein
MPLVCIWLNVTFGKSDNFRKEPLNFEVVNFPMSRTASPKRPCSSPPTLPMALAMT